MASTHKTPGLFLNKWLGTDKPKRDDFNTDNDRIDAAYGGLSARVGGAESALAAHAGDTGIHVTAAEKAAWGQGGGTEAATGLYQGDGASSRTVELGFRPRFGYLFAVGENAVDGDWNSGACNVYAGFFSENGCSARIALTDTGFTAQHQSTRPANGAAAKFNESGVTYVYVAWKGN